MVKFLLMVSALGFAACGVWYGDPQTFAAGALPAAVLLTSREQ